MRKMKMRKKIIVSVAVLAAASMVSAQVRRGNGIVPESSIERPEDVGVKMHTNDVVSAPISGCPIATTSEVPTGGSGVIVIVDAYDYPSAAADLATFSSEFGLPAPNFSVQYASGRKPANGCRNGWNG